MSSPNRPPTNAPCASFLLFVLTLLCFGLGRATAQTPAQQTVVTGGKSTAAASTASYASRNTPSGATPTAPADGDGWYDSTQSAEAFRQSTNTTVFRGGAISGCVNVTPVTVSSNTTMGTRGQTGRSTVFQQRNHRENWACPERSRRGTPRLSGKSVPYLSPVRFLPSSMTLLKIRLIRVW